MSELLDTKYNYVFYNVGEDYLEPVFGVLNKYPNVKTYGLAIKSNPLVEKLFFLHWSAKINSIIKLPLKSIWFKKMFDVKFENDKPVCYVFLGGKYIIQEKKIYSYLKNKNNDNKVIIYYGDLISKRNFDISKQKEVSDYIITYDEQEAKQYNICYHGNSLGYGSIIEVTEPKNFENDVYFVGFAKDRLDTIHNVYKYLTENGLKCKFIICGSKEEDRIQGEGLFYQEPIPYKESLENVNNSRCILDIIQGGSAGETLRVKESQVYKRKLLTNNVSLKHKDYISEDNTCIFSSIDDIDIDFVKKDINYDSFCENEFNPIKFIIYLEQLILGGTDE